MEGITGAGELTLLAPSNEAFRRLGEKNLNALLANQQKLTEILQLHVIRRRLSSDEIIQNPLFSHVISPQFSSRILRLLFNHFLSSLLFQVESADRHRRLYFSAYGPDDNITVSVEGGGVNATIIQPDIGALNGIVHIIDRVLGVPTMTVIEKLRSDSIMRFATYKIKKTTRPNNNSLWLITVKRTNSLSKTTSSAACRHTETPTTSISNKSLPSLCPATTLGRLSIARWARLSRNSLWANIRTT